MDTLIQKIIFLDNENEYFWVDQTDNSAEKEALVPLTVFVSADIYIHINIG